MSLLGTLGVLTLSVILSFPLTRRWGRTAGWPLAGIYLVATAVFLPAVLAVVSGQSPHWTIPWVPVMGVNLALRADGIGVVFSLIALLIGALVFCYAATYLKAERQLSFYLVMTTFTLSMVGLVLADDMVFMFICWELTSIASFLLIARSGRPGEMASMRTLLVTFVGGLAFLTAVVLIISRTATTSVTQALLDPVWQSDPGFGATVGALVAVAGFSKAAQFPFHIWLPDAMAAPTPVSAYLHAAAVVKAGIFLLMRFSPAFHHNLTWNVLLVVTGLFTAILGARIALEQTDLKRLLAYSTVSQLGLIVATIGIGTEAALTAAVLHTIAHALFKSGLFMMVGLIDHATHTRDLRRMPQLYRRKPWSFAVMLAGCASMVGLPPMLGFVSKEALFTGLLDANGAAWVGWLALAGAALASVMTFGYCVKMAFGGFVDGTDDRKVHPTEAPLLIVAAIPIALGLPLGLGVGVFDTAIGLAAEATVHEGTPEPHFALWHGPSAELAVTAVIIALGICFAIWRKRLWRRFERPLTPFDGPQAIQYLRRGTRRVGSELTSLTSYDHPARHLIAIVGALVVLLGAGLSYLYAATELPASRGNLNRPFDVVLLGLIAVSVISVCRSQSRLAATVSLSAVGILMTVQIFLLGAPDVGLTQLLVESLTVIVIMLVLQRLPLRFTKQPVRRRVRTAVIAGLAGICAAAATWTFAGRRDRSAAAEYFLTETKGLTGGYNVVNVILVEFRALDTLGELTVLGMAGVAVVAVLSTVRTRLLDPPPTRDPNREPEATPLLRPRGTPAFRAIHHAWPNVVGLQIVVRFVNPLLAVVSALLFLRGHNAPGGGFIAALVGSCIVGLMYLSTSRDRQIGPPRMPLVLISGGILVAVGTGVWGLIAKGSFLEPLHGFVGGAHLTSSMLFDLGVYAAVLGLILVAFNLLGASAVTGEHPRGEETRERADELVEGELPGPLDTVRGERPARVGPRTSFVTSGRRPKEPGR